ncbi:MAG: Ig-like domain-containing protein [Candidatus Freyarchaeum deiterrae]
MKHKKILLSLIIIASLLTGILVTTLLQPQQTSPLIPPTGTTPIQMAKTPTISSLTQENLTLYPSALHNSTNAIAIDSFSQQFFSLSTPSNSYIAATAALIQSHVAQQAPNTQTNISDTTISTILKVPFSQMWNQTIGGTIVLIAINDPRAQIDAINYATQLFNSFQSALKTFGISVQANGSAYIIYPPDSPTDTIGGVVKFTTLNSSTTVYNILNGIIPAGTFAKTLANESSPSHLIQIIDGKSPPVKITSAVLSVGATIEGKIGQSGSNYTFSTRNLLNISQGKNITLQASPCGINITLPTGSNITNKYPSTANITTTPPSISYGISTGTLNITDLNVTYKVLTQESLTEWPSALPTDAVAMDNFNETFFNLPTLSGQYITKTFAFIQPHFAQQTQNNQTNIFNTMIPLKQLNVSISQMWNQTIGGAIVFINSSDPNASIDAISNATQLFNEFQAELSTFGIIAQANGNAYSANSSLFPGTILGIQWFATLNSSATVYSILNGIIPANTFAKTIAGESSPSHLIQIADEMNNMTGNVSQNSWLSVGATIAGQIGQSGINSTFSTRTLLNISPGSNITSQAPSSYINITLPTGSNITNKYPPTASNTTTPPSISYGSSTGTLNITDVNVTYTLPPPPSVTITYPNTTIVNAGTFNVTWSSSSPNLAYYLFSIDGVTPVNVGLATSYPVSGLSDSSHSVNVTVVNLAGLSGYSVYSFNVTYPSVTITYPSDGSWLPSGTFNVTWSSSSQDLAYYLISVDGKTPFNVGLATSYSVSGLSDGPHNVSVTVVNQHGLNGSSVNSFHVFSTAPSVTITYPSSGSWLSYGTFTVTWSSSSPYLTYYLVSVDTNAPVNVSSTTTSLLVNGLLDGSHSVNVTAVNLAGLSGSSVKSFNVFSITPSVTITYPSDGSWLSYGTFTVTWSSSSANLAYYNVSVDGAAPFNVGLATSYSVSGLSDGPHNVSVTAVNLAGLSDSSVNYLGVDTAPPTVSITSPGSGVFLKDTSSVTVNWTGSDATSDIAYFEVSINSGAWINVSEDNFTYTFTNITNGNNTVNVTAFDLAGNSATASVTFSVSLPQTALASSLILMSLTPKQNVPLTYLAGVAVAIMVASAVLVLRRKYTVVPRDRLTDPSDRLSDPSDRPTD